jgi:hypothetical protein
VAHLSGAAEYIDRASDSDDEHPGDSEASEVPSFAMSLVELFILTPAISYYIVYALLFKPAVDRVVRVIRPNNQNIAVG